MTIRRNCDPLNVKYLWDAIRSTINSRQACDINRIHKYMQNKGIHCDLNQVELYLQQCLDDGLIMYVSRIKRKNTSPDLANATYRIPDRELPVFDGNDWYCFECHLAGDVNLCSNCYRVFHVDCIKKAKKRFEEQKSSSSLYIMEETNIADSEKQLIPGYRFNEKLCSVCNIINDDSGQMNKSEINYLLKFVLHRIRNWLPNTITNTMAVEDRPAWLTDTELTWRSNQLFFEHRDMSVIEVNLNSEYYNILSEFLADVLTVQHNVAIFHGIDSQEFQASEFVIRDTVYDIIELRNCSDCYKHSNEKINGRWFTLPCAKLHELVWAKQTGYPYWPAKVMNESFTHYDVRFFGGKHERSLILKSCIKPITVKKESFKKKPSAALRRALDELNYHRRLLSDPEELERVIAESNAKRALRKTLPFIPTAPSSNASTLSSALSSSFSSISASLSSSSSNAASSQDTPIKRQNSEPTEVPLAAKKSKTHVEQTSCNSLISGNVINISDGDEEKESGYSFRENNSQSQEQPHRFEDHHHEQQVSSSTENYNDRSSSAINQKVVLHQLDQPYSDSVEKMRHQMEAMVEKNDLIKCAMDCMQTEVDRIIEENNEHLKRLFESHNAQISETKRKQWCYNCEQDAIYHCCWNTAYCSQTCQQQHWQAEHKKVCRRKRQN